MTGGAPSGSADFARALGARLRRVRVEQHLSLHGVERKSEGRWKAVVVGAYERGDRAVSVQRLVELAEFYGVPLAEFLPAAASGHTPSGPGLNRMVILLDQVDGLTMREAAIFKGFVAAIRRHRSGHRGNTLALRLSDLPALAMMYDTTTEGLTAQLMHWGVLAPESVILDAD